METNNSAGNIWLADWRTSDNFNVYEFMESNTYPEIISTDRNAYALVVLLLISVILMFQFGFVSVRGSDQYWYLADTETLISKGTTITNTRFPGMILRQQIADPETHFAHNGPTLHLNASIGRVIGALNAWKLTGFLFLVGSAVFTSLIVSKLTDRSWGKLAFMLYILSPIAIWQSGNLLREGFFAFLAAAVVWLYLNYDDYSASKWIIPTLLFVGVLAHPMFLVLSALYLLHLFVSDRNPVLILLTFAIIGIAVINKTTWFPTSFQPDIKSIIASSIPGQTNMLWQLSDIVNPITPGLLINKLTDAVHTQFLNVRLMPLYVVGNLGILAFFYLAIFEFKKYRQFLIVAFMLIGLYAALVVLMQNQPRYQLLVASITSSTLVLVLSELKWTKIMSRILSLGLAGLFIVDVAIANKIRNEALQEKSSVEYVKQKFQTIPTDATVALVGQNTELSLSLIYALKPRKTLLIDARFLTQEKINKTLELFLPDIIVSDSRADFSEHYHRDTSLAIGNTKLYSELIVYQKTHSDGVSTSLYKSMHVE